MKSMKKAIALALMSLAALSSQAATQGNADAASSVATFVNSLGTAAVPRQIRVFGVQDAHFPLGHTGLAENVWGSYPGIQNGFCVADTTGGAVRIVFSSPGHTEYGAIATSFWAAATSATTGAKFGYQGTFKVGSGAWSDNPTQTVPAGVTQTDLVACTTPNVQKSLHPDNAPLPANNVFSDTVTITATPL